MSTPPNMIETMKSCRAESECKTRSYLIFKNKVLTPNFENYVNYNAYKTCMFMAFNSRLP